jgi:tellurite resistance protein TerC
VDVSAGLWAATLLILVGVIVLDLLIVDRRDAPFTRRNALNWVIFYVCAAAAFAVFVGVAFGWTYAGQFVAGYLTEYSLSVDNLFVFMVIMASFAVPPALQHRVLLVGVVIALILRGILIVLGAQLIERFEATFYVFGLFLLFTAWKVWSADDAEPNPHGNVMVRWIGRHVRVSPNYDEPATPRAWQGSSP